MIVMIRFRLTQDEEEPLGATHGDARRRRPFEILDSAAWRSY
jgi:hypothetical protein